MNYIRLFEINTISVAIGQTLIFEAKIRSHNNEWIDI